MGAIISNVRLIRTISTNNLLEYYLFLMSTNLWFHFKTKSNDIANSYPFSENLTKICVHLSKHIAYSFSETQL
jgi:hypothetical protein